MISYQDIGDYLSSDEKLAAVAEDQHRKPALARHHAERAPRLARTSATIATVILSRSRVNPARSSTLDPTGWSLSRDAWVYNSSEHCAAPQMSKRWSDFYNEQLAVASPARAGGTDRYERKAQRATQAEGVRRQRSDPIQLGSWRDYPADCERSDDTRFETT